LSRRSFYAQADVRARLLGPGIPHAPKSFSPRAARGVAGRHVSPVFHTYEFAQRYLWPLAWFCRKITVMANPTITIPLDPQTAQAYNSAAPEQKRKIQALLSLWVRELATAEYPSLQQVLDDVGRKAKERGLNRAELLSLTGVEPR
jgi:hypothetical protein